VFLASATDQRLEPGDRVTVAEDEAHALGQRLDPSHLPRLDVDDASLAEDPKTGTLVEAVVPSDADLVGSTVDEPRWARCSTPPCSA